MSAHDTDGPHAGSHPDITPAVQAKSSAPHTVSLPELSMRYFDPAYYLEMYSDLRAAFGSNLVLATRHYITIGYSEFRSPNPFFNPDFCRSNYSDLQFYTGEGLLEHWYLHGIDEARQGSPWFDINFYLNHHGDLKNTYGDDYAEAFNHWKWYGHTERRQTAPSKTLQLIWGDSKNPDGSFPLADGTGDCVPEEPIHQVLTNGRILGLLCKEIPHIGLREGCKRIINKVAEFIDPDPKYTVCSNPDGSDGVRVRDDPIFHGDIHVPHEVTEIA